MSSNSGGATPAAQSSTTVFEYQEFFEKTAETLAALQESFTQLSAGLVQVNNAHNQDREQAFAQAQAQTALFNAMAAKLLALNVPSDPPSPSNMSHFEQRFFTPRDGQGGRRDEMFDNNHRRGSSLLRDQSVEAPHISTTLQPFTQTLTDASIISLWAFWKHRERYINTNLYAHKQGQIPGLFGCVALPLQSALQSSYPEVSTMDGDGSLLGTGWPYMSDDFILSRLIRLNRVRSQQEYLDAIYDFIDTNRPNIPDGAKILEPKTVQYWTTETARVCLDLLRFHELLQKSVAEDNLSEPNPKTPYDDKLHPTPGKQTLMYEVILRTLVPVLSGMVKDKVQHEKLKMLRLPDLIKKIVETCHKFNEDFQPLRAHLASVNSAYELHCVKKSALPKPPSEQLVNNLASTLDAGGDDLAYMQHGLRTTTPPTILQRPSPQAQTQAQTPPRSQHTSHFNPMSTQRSTTQSPPSQPRSDTPVRPPQTPTAPQVCLKTVHQVISDGHYDPVKHAACSTPGCGYSHDQTVLLNFARNLTHAMKPQTLHALDLQPDPQDPPSTSRFDDGDGGFSD